MKALALKYRPIKFENLIEQESIKIILREQLSTSTFKHAYLFCGPAGCGKTTAARIFANELNKYQGNPIEIDAASKNGVDDVREIIENAKRKSLSSEFKVFILDEVHMFSMGAWNALLKLIEEPPISTVFIMCTTDPQKIPATILSRVQRYDFSKISLNSIVKQLKYILSEENAERIINKGGSQDALKDMMWAKKEGIDIIEYDTEAIEYIAKLSDGGMRDAITLMDKCLSFSEELIMDNVVKALGTVDYEVHFELMYMITAGPIQGAVEIIEEVYNSGKDLKQFIKQFQYFILDVLKLQMFDSFHYVNIPNINNYEQRAKDEDYEVLLKVLDWLRQLNANLKWESNAKPFVQTEILLFGTELRKED